MVKPGSGVRQVTAMMQRVLLACSYHRIVLISQIIDSIGARTVYIGMHKLHDVIYTACHLVHAIRFRPHFIGSWSGS